MAISKHLSLPVAPRLIHDFPADVRRRAATYVDRVDILEGDAARVVAHVRGTRRYTVEIERDRNVIEASCTCPYYLDSGACKHLWAALVASDRAGFLRHEADDRAPLALHETEPLEDEDAEDVSVLLRPKVIAPRTVTRPMPGWSQSLAAIERQLATDAQVARSMAREIVYIIDAAETTARSGLLLEVGQRERKRDGSWGKPVLSNIKREDAAELPAADREILALLGSASLAQSHYGYGYSYDPGIGSRHRFLSPLPLTLFETIGRTGRCFLRTHEDLVPLLWDDARWEFWLELADAGDGHVLRGSLRAGDRRAALSEPLLLMAGGLVLFRDRLAAFDHGGAFPWVVALREGGELPIQRGQEEKAALAILQMPRVPRIEWPEHLRFEEITAIPRPRLRILAPKRDAYSYGPERLVAELSFDYEGQIIGSEDASRFFALGERKLLRRDLNAEREFVGTLNNVGFKPDRDYASGRPRLALAPRKLPVVVRELLEAGWHVEAEGSLYRRPGAFHIEVQSGIDWFDLDGTVEFGDQVAHLPALLAALRKGESMVRLGDGSFGLLPEDWLRKYELLGALGTAEGEVVRFRRSQAGFLDALLLDVPEVRWDEAFARVRRELRQFEGIAPKEAPPGFVGALRDYQRHGLGWLDFLRRFGLGGCLADDMGLGKTVQVLALLEQRRTTPDRKRPALVVVPRSLVFNWKQEAARFAPELRVLDHTGLGRLPPGRHFEDYDVILTTYGTLRRDAVAFKRMAFDYVILDEAQAIKNARTEAAKAVRLLSAQHRLALSGTPIENHLGELWSLFEFLNPGLLGASTAFREAIGPSPDEAAKKVIARALRPFILRRTKEQVARDLPARVEQTLQCDLDVPQRKLYDGLREHYRRSVLARVDRDGMNKAKMHVLEALLRLRQAACHPGLVDPKLAREPGAKIDALMEHLDQVLAENHKALVFSQFTSFLAIVRARLDGAKIPYEYLDGKTRDRKERVERFQSLGDCKLFLISLKAGGLGLNLTAADYVFLLDPWWNPAVEAQAIDRAHRIGQDKPVFAYRLIARNTVEEKILELQTSKRALADAILSADPSVLRTLSRDDLELLFS